ncbi:Ger(x)C family spore germination protein [Paenibacillus sp. 1P07SE]|uniref:Ger(x)C family spore germination protein n=1 Tax=Paenibacillus sp. 1P07SE TaxID=3132209 RepID=UPI0039A4F427
MIRLATICLLAVSLLILPGCWSRKELNELAVIVALGIDKTDEGLNVSAQVVNPTEIGMQRGSIGVAPVITYSAKGQTLPDALQRILSQAPRQLYLSHLRVLVFGESLAREGLSDVLDFIARNNELRTDFYLLVAHNSKASDILQVLTPFEHIPANSLNSSILVSHKQWAATGKITLQQFVTELGREGANPVVSGVEIIGNKEKGQNINNLHDIKPSVLLRHSGMALFDKDKLVGWVDEKTSKSINYILDEVNETVGHVRCPDQDDGIVGVKIVRSDAQIDVSLDQSGRPEFKVNFKIEADLDAIQCKIDLNKEASILKIEKEMERSLKQVNESSVQLVQRKYKTDVFGFGEALHRKYPKVWSKYRNQWQDVFPQMQVTVDADVRVLRIGSIVQPLRRDMRD